MNINENCWILNTSENYIPLIEGHKRFSLQFSFFFKSGPKIKVLSNQTQLIPLPRKQILNTVIFYNQAHLILVPVSSLDSSKREESCCSAGVLCSQRKRELPSAPAAHWLYSVPYRTADLGTKNMDKKITSPRSSSHLLC